MQFEYDPDRLIEEVKKRPGIWDYDHPDYRAKNMRFHLWNEVVMALMQTTMKLSKSEIRELEIQLQKKWKSIRDCFQKYLLRPNRTRRPYIYAKQLQFLLRDQDLPRKDEIEDGTTESDEETKVKKVWRSRKKLKLIKDEEQTSEDDVADVDTMVDVRDESNETMEINIPQNSHSKMSRSQTDEFAFASVDSQKTDTDDPDRLFLLSLLPHMKSIPEEFRLNVKMELMQVLRNANYATSKEHKLI
ncbi:uncharacterized protein LOC115456254 [Manduca sexta]|uniref:uncharacterized protein LOC115456254 n=1 Tax=Manduca sexta TaxID=7130 RepID=UPI0011837A8C|nr:uncharacterized protein LOC115456254 [Manduca sexta]